MMIVGRWCVQLAAIWHWYLPLCIYVTFFSFFLKSFVCFCPFLPFLSLSLSLFFFLSFFFPFLSPSSSVLVLKTLTEWSTIPACPSLMCSFNSGNTEGTDSSKMCVWCLCVFFFLLCLCTDWFCGVTCETV